MGIRKPLEKDIQRACLQLLRQCGIFCWRQNSGAMSGVRKGRRYFVRFASEPGVSDILGIWPDGRFLACEVKRPGEEPTAEQQSFIDKVNECGGYAVWVDSLDDMMSVLRDKGLLR